VKRKMWFVKGYSNCDSHPWPEEKVKVHAKILLKREMKRYGFGLKEASLLWGGSFVTENP